MGVSGLGVEGDGGEDPSTLKLRRDRGGEDGIFLAKSGCSVWWVRMERFISSVVKGMSRLSAMNVAPSSAK